LPTPLSPAEPVAPVTPEDTGARRPLIDLFPPAPAAAAGPSRARGTAPARSFHARARLAQWPRRHRAPRSHTNPSTASTKSRSVRRRYPTFLYHSTSYDRVIQELSDAIGRGDRVMTLTGEIGVGKTTLCRSLTGQLDRRTLTSLVADPMASVDDLLKTVLVDFGVLSRDDLARNASATSRELHAALAEFLASLASLQASAVVIVDEAQTISSGVLEQLRAWTDGESGQKRLQVLLVGQTPLTALLRRHEHRSLNRRIKVRCELAPLLQDEVAGYVMHRLSVAGSSVRVEFDDGAVARINAISRGVPRLVNLLCDRALTLGHQASASVIDAALIEEAAGALDLAAPLSGASRVVRTAVAILVLAALMLAGAGGAAWVFRDRLQQVIASWPR